MTSRRRLLLRDLAASFAFGAMALSGQVPVPAVAVFLVSAALSFASIRPFGGRARASAAMLAITVLGLYALVAMGRLELLVAACTCAVLVTAQRMLSQPGTTVDQHIYLTGLLMVSGGAALSADLGFAAALAGFSVCALLALGLGVLEAAAPEHSVRGVPAPLLWGAAWVLVGGAVFFVGLPRLSWNLAARRAGTGFSASVTGFAERVRLGGDGSLKSNPRVVLRARLDPDPSVERLERYWVGHRLDRFDGVEWSSTAHPHVSATRVELVRGGSERIRQSIELLPAYGARTLVALDVPARFGNAVAHLATYGARAQLEALGDDEVRILGPGGGFGYQAESLAASPSPGALAEPERVRRLALPANLDPRIPALARALADGATDPFVVAQRLERGLLARFRYSLELPGSTPDPLADFLFHRRAGHCEDFAAALAVMLRTLGIPSRVVSGFYGGERVSGEYVLRAGDAHAWVEADVAGRVVRLDATPPTHRSADSNPLLAWLLTRYEALEVRWLSGVVDYSYSDQAALVRRLQRPDGPAAAWSVPRPGPLAVACVLALVLAYGFRRWRPWSADPAIRLGRSLTRQLARSGYAAAEESLEVVAPRLGAELQPIREVIARYLDARFGSHPLAPGESAALLARARQALCPSRRPEGERADVPADRNRPDPY